MHLNKIKNHFSTNEKHNLGVDKIHDFMTPETKQVDKEYLHAKLLTEG